MKKIINNQVLVLLPAVIIFGIIVYYFYSSTIDKERTAIEANEILYINLGRQSLEKDLEAAMSDLKIISQHQEITEIDASDVTSLMGQAKEFKALLKSKQRYDQARLLDDSGKEIIRINYDFGQPYIVERSKLQDKSKRYYFENTIRLQEGEIFISPLDLNIENGEIEKPLKPVIRIATPVIYGPDKKKGVAIINYLGVDIVQNFKNIVSGLKGHAMLVHADGSLVYDTNMGSEWVSKFGHGPGFKEQFPDAWTKIINMGEGYFYNSNGLFTFTTVHVDKTHAGELDLMEHIVERNAKENYWKVIAHVPNKYLNLNRAGIVMELLMISAPLFALLVIGVLWLVKSQTQRQEVEEALIRGEAKFRTLFEASNDAIVIMTKDRFLDCNQAALNMFDFKRREELIGRHPREMCSTVQADGVKLHVAIDEHIAQACQKGSELFECINRRANGEDFPVEILLTPMELDGQQVIQANIRDITKRKQADEQLKKLSRAVEQSPSSIVITDPDGVIEYVNPKFSKITGYTFEEAVGENPRVLKSGHQPPEFYEELWQTISSGKQWNGELLNKKKNGDMFWERASISPVLDEGGNVTHFIAIKEDITDYKNAQAEHQQLQQQLQQAQKMESIGQLTGGIAHDFNNMLASILGFTELTREEIAQYNNEEIEGYLNEVAKSGMRARDLIEQMLLFSGSGDGKFKPMSLSPLIKESLKIVSSAIPSTIEIELQLDDDEFMVMTDPVKIHQIIINMCVNARDAMEGKGRISIGLKHVNNIAVKCCSCHESVRGDYIELYVRDTGSGIKPELLDRIFDPFYTTKAVGQGTGMGLSVVHGIAHDHGGHIFVESELDKGTSFNLLFPVIDATDENNETKDKNTGAELNLDFNGTVLVVDDEVSVGNFISHLLKSRGCNVVLETDSKSALSKFESSPDMFDLVVTDQVMPGMLGIELAHSLFAIRPDIPVILCSGYSGQINEASAKALGIRGYISKPIENREFLKLVGDLLKEGKS